MNSEIFKVISDHKPLVCINVDFKNLELVTALVSRIAQFAGCMDSGNEDEIWAAMRGNSGFSMTFPEGGIPFTHNALEGPCPDEMAPVTPATMHVVANMYSHLAASIRQCEEGLTVVFTDNDTGRTYDGLAVNPSTWYASIPNKQNLSNARIVSAVTTPGVSVLCEAFLTFDQMVRLGKVTLPQRDIVILGENYTYDRTIELDTFLSDIGRYRLNSLKCVMDDDEKLVVTPPLKSVKLAAQPHGKWTIAYVGEDLQMVTENNVEATVFIAHINYDYYAFVIKDDGVYEYILPFTQSR